jgi:hypothetical protein
VSLPSLNRPARTNAGPNCRLSAQNTGGSCLSGLLRPGGGKSPLRAHEHARFRAAHERGARASQRRQAELAPARCAAAHHSSVSRAPLATSSARCAPKLAASRVVPLSTGSSNRSSSSSCRLLPSFSIGPTHRNSMREKADAVPAPGAAPCCCTSTLPPLMSTSGTPSASSAPSCSSGASATSATRAQRRTSARQPHAPQAACTCPAHASRAPWRAAGARRAACSRAPTSGHASRGGRQKRRSGGGLVRTCDSQERAAARFPSRGRAAWLVRSAMVLRDRALRLRRVRGLGSERVGGPRTS